MKKIFVCLSMAAVSALAAPPADSLKSLEARASMNAATSEEVSLAAPVEDSVKNSESSASELSEARKDSSSVTENVSVDSLAQKEGGAPAENVAQESVDSLQNASLQTAGLPDSLNKEEALSQNKEEEKNEALEVVREEEPSAIEVVEVETPADPRAQVRACVERLALFMSESYAPENMLTFLPAKVENEPLDEGSSRVYVTLSSTIDDQKLEEINAQGKLWIDECGKTIAGLKAPVSAYAKNLIEKTFDDPRAPVRVEVGDSSITFVLQNDLLASYTLDSSLVFSKTLSTRNTPLYAFQFRDEIRFLYSLNHLFEETFFGDFPKDISFKETSGKFERLPFTIELLASKEVSASRDTLFIGIQLPYEASEENEKRNKKEKPYFFDVGVGVGLSYGQLDVKLDDDHFMLPALEASLSLLAGYSNFSIRAFGTMKYEYLHADESGFRVNEPIMRVGGGAAFRAMSNVNSGVTGEVGISAFGRIAQNPKLPGIKNSNLGMHMELPIEVAFGYKFPAEIYSFDLQAFFDYDLKESLEFFYATPKNLSARNWRIGARATLWFFDI